MYKVINVEKELKKSEISLDEEQKKAVKHVMEGKSLFLTGKAGTGKSTVVNKMIELLIKKYNNDKRRIGITASTGLAASNIGGITLHSFSRIGVNKTFQNTIRELHDVKNTFFLKRWREVETLIIDEISMVDKETFEKVERVARYIRKKDKMFGEIQMIVVGDFSQLPPVKGEYLFNSELWNPLFFTNKIFLTNIYRQNDKFYIDGLNKIRLGMIPDKEFLKFIDELEKRDENKFEIYPTKLYSTNKQVAKCNREELNKLRENDSVVYVAKDNSIAYDKERQMIKLPDGSIIRHKDLMATFEKNYPLVDREVELKVGAIVILTKNIKNEDRLVNGLKGTVVGFKYRNQIYKEKIPKNIKSEELKPIVKFYNINEPIPLSITVWKKNSKDDNFLAMRKQIPLKLAFGMSMHKCQGMSLPSIYVDFDKVFLGPQLYVSLSRAIDTKNLKVINFKPNKIHADPQVINFMKKNFKKEINGEDNVSSSNMTSDHIKMKKRKGDDNLKKKQNKMIKLE
jgi:ATP-dependent DNA helicase PIF1